MGDHAAAPVDGAAEAIEAPAAPAQAAPTATTAASDVPRPPVAVPARLGAPPTPPVAAAPSDTPSSSEVAPPPVSSECADALAAVEAAGLVLPEGTAFRCPGSTETFPGDRQHSGVACWGNARFCPGASYISVNPAATGDGPENLEYVIAHEICHIQAYLRGDRGGTEPAADACAARAGFPRPSGGVSPGFGLP